MKEGSEPVEKPPRRLNPLYAIAVVVLAYFGSQIFGGVVVGVGAGLLGYDEQQVLSQLESNTFVQFCYILAAEAMALAILWWFMRRRGVGLPDIGLGRKPKNTDIGYGLATFGIYFVALIAVTTLVSLCVPSINLDQEQLIGFEAAKAPAELALVFVSLVILPPLVEEIMIRGFLYTGLRARFTKITSALIASILFGVAHLQLGSGEPPLWIAAIDTCLLSLFLIYLREKTGSLWAGIFVHAIKNGLAFFVLFIVQR